METILLRGTLSPSRKIIISFSNLGASYSIMLSLDNEILNPSDEAFNLSCGTSLLSRLEIKFMSLDIGLAS